jgi:hypothetical protein
MNETDKLRVLIPHWIDHNKEHADEFRRWAAQAGDASADILAAAEAMTLINERLVSALDKLGGALTWSHDQGEHDHDRPG